MSKDINTMTNYEIERYLESRKLAESNKRAEVQRKKQEAFKKATDNLYIYHASDYCGLRIGEYEFYYGYEVEAIPKGKKRAEWAFTATVNGVQQMILPMSQLYPEEDVDNFYYLLSGIGQFLRKISPLTVNEMRRKVGLPLLEGASEIMMPAEESHE
jgi:hypothetical protein